MKLLTILLFVYSSFAQAGIRDDLVSQCKVKMKAKTQDQSEILRFCSCFSSSIISKTPNLDVVSEENKKTLFTESAKSCATGVKSKQSKSAWTDQLKYSVVQKCLIDSTMSKITKDFSDNQKAIYCECYISKVTQSLSLSEINGLSQDKLMEKLAPKVIECKKKAGNSTY